MTHNRIANFSAGPAALPESVLEIAKNDLLNFKCNGMSIMEISHRTPPFEEVRTRAEAGIRKLLSVPDDYAVLFLHGGASQQFFQIPMNLYQPARPVDFINTGVWTKKALTELKKLGEYRMAGDTEITGFKRVPSVSELNLHPDASYVYLCSNNTIYGTQWKTFPKTGDIPLIADMSSDIMSRPINVSDFGLIFAGAQKNIGPSGVCVVILQKALLDRCPESVPTLLQYRVALANDSMFNTPNTWGIYLISLVMDWLETMGGVPGIAKLNREKAQALYDFIDDSDYYYAVAETESRSDMNVCFRIKDSTDNALEMQLVKEALAKDIYGIKGHKLVGGLRASIYNAVPMESVTTLIGFLKTFKMQNPK